MSTDRHALLEKRHSHFYSNHRLPLQKCKSPDINSNWKLVCLLLSLCAENWPNLYRNIRLKAACAGLRGDMDRLERTKGQTLVKALGAVGCLRCVWLFGFFFEGFVCFYCRGTRDIFQAHKKKRKEKHLPFSVNVDIFYSPRKSVVETGVV